MHTVDWQVTQHLCSQLGALPNVSMHALVCSSAAPARRRHQRLCAAWCAASCGYARLGADLRARSGAARGLQGRLSERLLALTKTNILPPSSHIGGKAVIERGAATRVK
jgi:hypothetical protein